MDTLIELIFGAIQAATMLIIAPLIIGIIRKFNALFQSRRGASIIQPYYELAKLFHKGQVISKEASWIFKVTPFISMTCMIVATAMIPVFIDVSLDFLGNIIVLVYLMAMFRFFMTLAALDTGSSFGGMGSSREVMISAIMEPTVFMCLYAMVVITSTTYLSGISAGVQSQLTNLSHPSIYIAFISFFIVTLAENARYPFDNPTTHLELTMVHEAMILEYSGKSLGLMEYSSWTKLTCFLALLVNIFFPWGIATSISWSAIAIGIASFLGKIIALALVIALIESSMSKFRLFKLPVVSWIAFSLAFMAVILSFL
ncbi:MAG TPA: NADH-quinone oxidoreductase subunit H [Candidatus Lokiarchaeia archaeon]|nr:NADH-quinone oxidoreductase subunit H [Candidatus Lokiarchaeia archaeon]